MNALRDAPRPRRQLAGAFDRSAQVVVGVAVELHPALAGNLLPRQRGDGGQQAVMRGRVNVLGDVPETGDALGHLGILNVEITQIAEKKTCNCSSRRSLRSLR